MSKIKPYTGFIKTCFTIIPKPHKNNLNPISEQGYKKLPSTTKTIKIKFSSEISSVHMNKTEVIFK